MGRRRRLTAMVAATLAALAVVLVPAAPSGATVGDPPIAAELGGGAVTDLLVHGATGRVFVAGPTSVRVLTADLVPVGTVAVGGTELADAGSAVALLSPDTTSVTRIDPTTLATATWSLGARARPSGLVAEEGRALTTALLPGGTGQTGQQALVEVDLATGATTELVTNLGTRPLLLAGAPWKTIVVQHVAVTNGAPTSSQVWQVRSPQEGSATVTSTGSIPLRAVRTADLTHDAIALTVTSDAARGEARVFSLDDLSPQPTIAVGREPVSLGAGYLLAVTSLGQSTIEVLDPFAIDDRLVLPATSADLPAGRRLAFGPSDARLYAVGGGGSGAAAARLLAYDLRPAATTVSPRVVDVDGGATLTVAGRGLAGAEAYAYGIPLTVSGSSDERLDLTAGQAWGGTEPVDLEVTGRLHVAAPAGLRVRALQLGPFADGRALADGAYRDISDRPADALEREAVDTALLADGDPGRIFVALSGQFAFRGARSDLMRLYHATLGRAPDLGGLEYWDAAWRSGRPYASIVRAFTASPEFRARYGSPSDAAFVDLLYANLLGRAPDAGGRSYWLAQLRRGVSRDRVVLLFTDSPENVRRYQPEAAAMLLALGMLDRLPTAAERTRWIGLQSAGGSPSAVAVEILRSAEYAAQEARRGA